MHLSLLALCGSLLLAPAAAAETWFWVDDRGVTHISDDAAQVPEGARGTSADGGRALGELWSSAQGSGEGIGSSGTPEQQRIQRLLKGAAADLERAENARAAAALMSVLRLDARNPEAHWYLALLARQRGRYETAEVHLRAFLHHAGDSLEPWRISAQRRLEGLRDERRLADEDSAQHPDRWLGANTSNFRVYYHAQLGEASPDYATKVLHYLGEARSAVGERLGTLPSEPMGVLFYGKAAYLRAHRHRFSFQTVGFFDGRIHVVSAAHPAGELRALLFHEYAHAVYREQTGEDRPFWLNEGLAELAERASRGTPGLSRSERSALRIAIDSDEWIPLRTLAPGFSGLDNRSARIAYLEAAASATWLEARTDRAGRGRILARLGEDGDVDAALLKAVGLDTEGVDAALRSWILEEFSTLGSARPEPHSRPADEKLPAAAP